MLVLRNAHVLTMDKFTGKGDVAIDDNLIVEVSAHIAAGGSDEIIDLDGKFLMPGMIDAHCHIGMWEDGMGQEGADGNEMTDPVTPQLRAIDGINPFDPCFREAREHGVTAAVTGPGSANVIGGQFAALKTYGQSVEDMLIRSPAALKIAFGENPKRIYGEQKKSPMTRMATASFLRDNFFKAQDYIHKLQLGEKDESKMPDHDERLSVLAKVLQREIPLKAHAHRSDDILSAIRIAQEFGLDYSIDHCTEGYMIAEQLKNADAKVIIGPLICERGKIELRNLSVSAPARLEEAGIKFAIMTDHPVVPIQYLPVCAALAVREGLSEDAALKAITIYAAEITGISARVGSITPGKDADIAVFDRQPLDIMAKAQLVLINGEIVFDRRG